MITFHGTPNYDNMCSILKHGFLEPGDIHPETQISIPTQNGGPFYGNGIYSSPHFSYAAGYAGKLGYSLTGDKSYYMIISIIFMGVSKMWLDPLLLWKSMPENERPPQPNTTILPGLTEIIVRDKKDIIPLGYIEF
jgi:hypothetical protein